MKTFTKFSALVLIIIGTANTSFAQLAAVSAAKTDMTYAYNSVRESSNTPVTTNTSETNAANEKTMALLKYVRSEQFVFDNLSSLKKNYSIQDIYYDLDQASIRKDAEVVLDNLTSLMLEQPQLNVAVTAHCDSRMAGYNTTLAEKRAQAAKDYLIAKGIEASRIVMEKHGRPEVQNPCATNPGCSIADQQMNRRTEFNIILNGKNLAHMLAFAD